MDATPGTVARVAFTALLEDDPPQLVVSGINRGENDGLGAWTSGTVGAAREAVIAGVPSIDSRNVSARVMVDNGETLVLGGIYEQTTRDDVERGGLAVYDRYIRPRYRRHDSEVEVSGGRLDLAIRFDSDGILNDTNVPRVPEMIQYFIGIIPHLFHL